MKIAASLPVIVVSLIAVGCGTDASPFVGEYEGTWTARVENVETLEVTEEGPFTTVIRLTEQDGKVVLESEPCLEFEPNGTTATLRERTLCEGGAYYVDVVAGSYGTIALGEEETIFAMWRYTRQYHVDFEYEHRSVTFEGRRR